MSDVDLRSRPPVILTVPGLGGSGPGHWQTVWEETLEDCHRAELGLWDQPRRREWVTKLHHAIHLTDRPVVLAAHSLGCLAVAWWAAMERPRWCEKVVGALLVAPPEVDVALPEPRLAAFAPLPKVLLPFPSIVVASRNDPYTDFERARLTAGFWGSNVADAGAVGHINAESQLGEWSFGQFLLRQLIGGHVGGAAHPAGTVEAPSPIADLSM